MIKLLWKGCQLIKSIFRNGTYFTSFKHHSTFFSSWLVCESLGFKFLNGNCFGKYAVGDLYEDKDNFDDDDDYVSGNMHLWPDMFKSVFYKSLSKWEHKWCDISAHIYYTFLSNHLNYFRKFNHWCTWMKYINIDFIQSQFDIIFFLL